LGGGGNDAVKSTNINEIQILSAGYQKPAKTVKKENGCSYKGNYFFEYLKASIADLFTMLSSSVQNSEGRGDGNSSDSFADPCQEFKEGFFGVSSGLPHV
jgi:hypothetical protein